MPYKAYRVEDTDTLFDILSDVIFLFLSETACTSYQYILDKINIPDN